MIEWDENQHAVLGSDPGRSKGLASIAHDILMTEHDPFGQSCCATAVWKCQYIFPCRYWRCRRCRRIGMHEMAKGIHLGRTYLLVSANDNDMFQCWRLCMYRLYQWQQVALYHYFHSFAIVQLVGDFPILVRWVHGDRKSTRLNSSHTVISYAVFCLKKKNKISLHKEGT